MEQLQTILDSFQDPDRIYRPLQIVHNHFPKIEGQDAYIQRAIDAGMGGFVLTMGIVREDALPDPAAEQRRNCDTYMCNEDCPDWERMRIFIDKCYAAGLKVWLYDEDTYPSGMAADKVLKLDPEYQVRGLVCQTIHSQGGMGQADMDEGRFLYAGAYRETGAESVRTADALPVSAEHGKLCWELPEGQWKILAFYTKKVGYGTVFGGMYPDMLREDVVAKFVEITHERYVKYLGEERIRKMEAIFTDEPSIAVHGCSSWFYEKNAIAGWTDSFEADFPARFGYPLFPHLPELFWETDTDYGKVRRDYWRLVSDTFARTFFRQIGDWCDKHGIESTGHLYGEESLGMQIGLNGDLFGLHCRMQMPGVDRLYANEPRDVIPEKTASSAAHLMGRRRSMSESSFHFEANFWDQKNQIKPDRMINSCFYQYLLGINNITSYYPYNKFSVKQLRRWTDAVSRVGAFLTNGTHKASALVLIPMNAAWEKYQPRDYKYWTVGPMTVSRWQTPALKKLEKSYGDVLLGLMDSRHDFDLIDEPHLRWVYAENGKVCTDYEQFDRLVVFGDGVPDAGTLDQLRLLLEGGCRVELVEQGAASAYDALAAEYPRLVSRIAHPSEVCADCPPQLEVGADSAVWVRHSILDGADVYFLHNRADTTRFFPVTWDGKAKLFWPLTGKVEEREASGELELRLGAREAVLLLRQTSSALTE